MRSGYSGWVVGWDSAGDYRSIYLDVRGHAGETSDTKVLRWLLKVEVGPDTDPEWRPRFYVDRESGNVMPLERLAPVR